MGSSELRNKFLSVSSNSDKISLAFFGLGGGSGLKTGLGISETGLVIFETGLGIFERRWEGSLGSLVKDGLVVSARLGGALDGLGEGGGVSDFLRLKGVESGV